MTVRTVAIEFFRVYQLTLTLVGGTTLSSWGDVGKLAGISGFGGDLIDSTVVAAK